MAEEIIGVGAKFKNGNQRIMVGLNEEQARKQFIAWHYIDGVDKAALLVFDPALVEIRRIRFSVCQGEVEVKYGGKLVAQFGDPIKLNPESLAYEGAPDEVWIDAARDWVMRQDLA